jgi:deoxyribonuclease-4
MSTLRIREILDGLKGTGRRPLLKYIPKFDLPADTKGLFPSAILSVLPHDKKYSLVGLITEALVLSSEPITTDTIINEFAKYEVEITPENQTKIKKSKTTVDYIQKIIKTREELVSKLSGNTLILQGQELSYECIKGHPDGICGKTIIEVKTTSKLEDDIQYYMLQLLSYIAIGGDQYTQALLVLPLQQCVLAFNMSSWTDRIPFRTLLLSKTKKLIESTPVFNVENAVSASILVSNYNVGTHVNKAPTLFETVQNLIPGTPYQIFLGGNQNTSLNIKDGDLAFASDYVAKNNIILYIHSPYIINLSATTLDNWHLHYVQKLLQYGATLGVKGVVVHVGKHTSDSYEVGVEKMRKAIETILPFGTPECPLLLETPAGQGTETLQKQIEFLDFVESFNSSNIKVCVDTCHVFANGHEPLAYIVDAFERNLLRLVHYNDSMDCCGSCKDRHAMVGQGHIGIEKMASIAKYCSEKHIYMVIE